MATDLERFVEADGRADLVEDVRRRIDAEGITYIYYQFPSVTGRIMGKGVPAQHWETIAEKGFQLVYGATANLFTDRHGNYIGYGPEAAELVGVPSPTRSSRSPGTRRSPASGASASATARSARTRRRSSPRTAAGTSSAIQAEFEDATGLHLRAGTEPEMMWLELNEDGTPRSLGRRSPTATTSTSSPSSSRSSIASSSTARRWGST